MSGPSRRRVLAAGASSVATGLSGSVVAQASRTASDDLRIEGLTVDFLKEPIGLDNARPVFGWRYGGSSPGVRQLGYRIRVASSADRLADADLWDSGRRKGRSTLAIPYEGRPPALLFKATYGAILGAVIARFAVVSALSD